MALRYLQQGQDKVKKPSTAQIYVAGCAGGFAQLIVACPVDLVKIKLQTQTGNEIMFSKHETEAYFYLRLQIYFGFFFEILYYDY